MGAPSKTSEPSKKSETTRSPRRVSDATQTSPSPVVQLLQKPTSALTPKEITTLQRTVGNRAVQRLLNANIPASRHHMPTSVQARMEDAFQSDFSEVRVHPDSPKVGMGGAQAVTEGNDIHFASGRYTPNTETGQRLLGHELAHVVQQRTGRVRPTGYIEGVAYNDSPDLEREADQSGALAARGAPATVRGDGQQANEGSPVQQHFWTMTTLLALAIGLGLTPVTVTGLVSTFGLVAVGYVIARLVKGGAKTVTQDTLLEELQQVKDQKVTDDEDFSEAESLTDSEDFSEAESLSDSEEDEIKVQPSDDLKKMGDKNPQLDIPSDTPKPSLTDIESKSPLPQPLKAKQSQPNLESDAPKKSPQDVESKSPSLSVRDTPIPALVKSKESQPHLESDTPKKSPKDVESKAPMVSDTPLPSPAEEKQARETFDLKKQAQSLKEDLEKVKEEPQMGNYLKAINAILQKSDNAIYNARGTISKIALALGTFRDESKRQEDLRKAKELKEAEDEQRRIEDEVRNIWTQFEEYKRQMAIAVAKFPDLASEQRDTVNLISNAKSVPDRDLSDYDRDYVQPQWVIFTAAQAQKQLGLDQQGGHRLFIFNTETDDLLQRQETIKQRLANFNGGRTSPFKKDVLHERLGEARVYNENVIYTWQGNDLYLHGVVMWHMDKDMKGSQKQETDTIEDRGNIVGNFVEARYNTVSTKYELI